MTKPEDLEAELEKWWSTEPFGFDHPDTKAGILKLMMWAATESSLIKELESALEVYSMTNETFPEYGDVARQALTALRKARGRGE